MDVKHPHKEMLTGLHGLAAFITDGSEREALYEALFEKMLFEVHIWELVRNPDGEIVTWLLIDANPAALKSWGKNIEEIEGKVTDEIFTDTFPTRHFMPIVQKIFEENRPHVWEQHFPYTDQNLHMVSIPVGERFISCGVDVTDVKNIQRELETKSSQVTAALMGVISGVSKTLESRDPYTAGHQSRVADICEKMGRHLKLDNNRVEGLRLGASIHDVGKIGIPVDFLTKPTRLTEVEFEIIKSHASAGAEIVKDVKFPWPIKEIIEQHHERLDGSGYPLGLSGDQIVLEARIVGVADVFESMSSNRPYRAALGNPAALDELRKNKGVLYDSEVVDALCEMVETGEIE